jgi:hypothetical protein
MAKADVVIADDWKVRLTLNSEFDIERPFSDIYCVEDVYCECGCGTGRPQNGAAASSWCKIVVMG